MKSIYIIIKKIAKKRNLISIQKKLDALSSFPKKSLTNKGYYLFFDTETDGLPKKRRAAVNNFSNWPYVVELAWILTDKDGYEISRNHYILKQNTYIPADVSFINHITNERMKTEGVSPSIVYREFLKSVENAECLVAHNMDFDLPILECDLLRNDLGMPLKGKNKFCTMIAGKELSFTFNKRGYVKYPKLLELFGYLYFNNPYIRIQGMHNAM